jgi:CarD family transcriptional regulator
MTFQVGEKVVYPNHGVGTIENISTRAFGPQHERFYLLRLSYNSMTVMVPFSHVGDVGLRKLTKAAEISRVLTFLATGTCKSSADWKVRFKVNSASPTAAPPSPSPTKSSSSKTAASPPADPTKNC